VGVQWCEGVHAGVMGCEDEGVRAGGFTHGVTEQVKGAQ